MSAMGKILDPKNDFLFKRLFATERNRDLLIHFLNDVFEGDRDPILRVKFIKTSMDPRFAAERQSLIDVLCEDVNGVKFIIEMQVGKEKGFEKRAQYYAANVYVDQRDKGKKYNDLKEVVFLAILDHKMFPKKQAYIHHHVILDKATGERNLKGFSFSFIELGKFKKKIHELETMLDKWCFFFKHAKKLSDVQIARMTADDDILKRAFQEIDAYNLTRPERLAYASADMYKESAQAKLETALEDALEQGLAQGLEQGLEQGMEKGMDLKTKEIAKNLLSQSLSWDLIAMTTGLSVKEIEKLKESGSSA